MTPCPDSAGSIGPVETPSDLAAVINLFRAYAEFLTIDLAYQDFDREMAALPGRYAPPGGGLLLARRHGAGRRLRRPQAHRT